MNRRHFLGFFASSASLAACSTDNNALKTLASAYEASFGDKAAFDPSYPESLPYASIAVSAKNRSRALLVLGKAEGDERQWISADRGVLVTRHGRIIRTVGLNENLIKTDFSGPDFFERWGDERKSSKVNRVVDLMPGNRYGVAITSIFKAVGKETINIGSRSYQTTRFEENGTAPLLSWTFSNSYWADDKGNVWRSIQQLSPNAPAMTIEVTKPYRA